MHFKTWMLGCLAHIPFSAFAQTALSTENLTKLDLNIKTPDTANMECYANNQVSTYEYDNLGRLLRIKDANGNLIKTYEYQYQN